MLKGRNRFLLFAGLILNLAMLCGIRIDASASSTKECLDSLNAGISSVIGPGTGNNEEAIEELTLMAEEAASNKEPESDLVMADVQMALNVRAEATEDSEKVGLLYKDCGGKILERKGGWTKLQSGELVGWASDEYLLFGEDAEAMAGEVGNLIVTIQTDTLRVREEPSTDAAVLGLIAQDDSLDVIEVVNDEWISVEFESNTCYVSAEYVNMDFHIDQGETMEVIKAREEAEAEAKRQAVITANEAIVANADEARLLAALIQCEAGTESYNGQLAVGAVVMNRVRSGAYPNTIAGVIYASGQFTPALNGKVARVYNEGNISGSCVQAAQDALAGLSNVGEATHFRRAGNHEGILIDNQVFW